MSSVRAEVSSSHWSQSSFGRDQELTSRKVDQSLDQSLDQEEPTTDML